MIASLIDVLLELPSNLKLVKKCSLQSAGAKVGYIQTLFWNAVAFFGNNHYLSIWCKKVLCGLAKQDSDILSRIFQKGDLDRIK